ncbi:MAG: lipoyl(octanoyl) transferase [Planctomycetes bacterium]|nr:lipoyl(octanoyl) transferase [Planctomycetota bacterium]
MRTLKIIRMDGLVPYAAGYTRQLAEAEELYKNPELLAKLILLQHAPVYTLGRTTKKEHLLTLPYDEDDAPEGADKSYEREASTGPSPLASIPQRGEGNEAPEIVESDRGGSVTYHGPGQLTAYLLLNLKRWEIPIHQHLWNLEEAALRALAAFGLQGRRVEGMTGVWTDILDFGFPISDSTTQPTEGQSKIQNPKSKMAKVCAVGVACQRWMTFHGIGLNVDLDLAPFERIDPCGLGRKPVTSLSQLLGRPVAMSEAEEAVVKAFEEVLGTTNA